MMLHTKYQGCRPCGFGQEDFSCFHYISLCKTHDPLGRGQVLPQVHNWNKLGRCLLDDATYQISSL